MPYPDGNLFHLKVTYDFAPLLSSNLSAVNLTIRSFLPHSRPGLWWLSSLTSALLPLGLTNLLHLASIMLVFADA